MDFRNGGYELPDFRVDNKLELGVRGSIDEIYAYASAVELDKAEPECNATVEVVVGEEPEDPNYWKSHRRRRQLTREELDALEQLFGNGPVPMPYVYEHADDSAVLLEALRLLVKEAPIHLALD